MTMNDRVGVAELKARLSEYLRRVRRGQTVTVLDRHTEVARLVPIDSTDLLRIRRPPSRAAPEASVAPSSSGGGLQAVALPPPLDLDVDILELLREERRPDR
jgi:prevent-host-death family protein